MCDFIEAVRQYFKLECVFIMNSDQIHTATNLRKMMCTSNQNLVGWLPLERLICPLSRSRCTYGSRLIFIPQTIHYSELAKIHFFRCDINDIFFYLIDREKYPQSLDQLFKDIYITINTRFVVCQFKNQIYTFTEIFKIAENSQIETIYLGQWSKSNGFNDVKRYLPSIFQQRSNLKQIQFKTGLFNNATKRIKSTEFIISNYQREIWSEIAQSMNIRYEEVFIEGNIGQKLENGSWSGILGAVLNKTIDLATSIILHKERMEYVDYLRIMHSEKYFVFLRRPKLRVIRANIVAYIRPFSYQIWICLLFVLFTLSLCNYTIFWFDQTQQKFKSFISESLFNILSIMSQQGASYKPVQNYKTSGRFLIFVTFMISLIIYQSYSASIVSSLVVLDELLPFKNIEGLMNFGGYKITIYSSSGFIKDIKDNPDPTLHRLYRDYIQRLTDFPEFGYGMRKMIKTPNYAFINLESEGKFFLYENPGEDIYYFPLIKQPVMMTIILRKFNPYKRFINNKIQKMIEAGIIKRIHSHSLQRQTSQKAQQYESLDISQITLPLSLLGIGQIFSILILFFEIIIGKKTRKNKYNFTITN